MEYKFSEKKLGTTIEIIIIEKEGKDLEINENVNLLLKYIDNFEQEFSRFKIESKLNELNNNKKSKVSHTFLDILAKSMNLFRFTNAYFNPLLNLKNIGYTHNFSENNFEIINEKEDLDLEEIEVNGEDVILKENQNLDFGGIAKGYLVDKIDEKLSDFGYTNYLINAGGDIFMRGLNDEKEKWVIGIENPFDIGYIGTVSLSDVSISSSGSYKRHWQIKGESYHHIINPYTGKNENSLVGITIISSKCYITDSLATAIFAMGFDKGEEFMIKNGIDGILFGANKKILLTPKFKEKYSFTNL